ncbi:MAG: hypothetical protein NVS4B8_04920 [Herpetosiphon sp.]
MIRWKSQPTDSWSNAHLWPASRRCHWLVLVAFAFAILMPGYVALTEVHANPSIMTIPAWSSGGPFTNDVTAVATSAAYDSDQTVFMGVSPSRNDIGTAEIYRSADRGATWRKVASRTLNLRYAWLTQLVVSPAFLTDRTVFALWSGGMLRSTDGGMTFQDVPVGLGSKIGGNKTLSISPQFGSDRTIGVTDNSGTSAKSYLSTDGGTSWQAVRIQGLVDSCGTAITTDITGVLLVLGTNSLGATVITGNAMCTSNLNTRYAASSDGGAHWSARGDLTAASGSNFDAQHSRLSAAADSSIVFYTDRWGNALRSSDGGMTWTNLIATPSGLGNDIPPSATIGAGQEFGFVFRSLTVVYAVHEWGFMQPRIFKSVDGGATWTSAYVGNSITTGHDLAVPGAQTIFYAAGNQGLQRSGDDAATWQLVGTFRPAIYGLAVAPTFGSDRQVFGVNNGAPFGQDKQAYAIFRSGDAGTSWKEPRGPSQIGATYDGLTVNGGNIVAVSPNFATDGIVAEGDYRGALNLSSDWGVTWRPTLIDGQNGLKVNGLAFSPYFASDHTLYAGIDDNGKVLRTNDDGATWQSLVPGGVAPDRLKDLAVSAGPGGTVDLAIGEGKLYLARDDPQSTRAPRWVDTGFLGSYAHAVAMSPTYEQDCTVYASKWNPAFGTNADGVYLSTNACSAHVGAITWTRITAMLPVNDFDSIVLSPRFASDRTLFIGSNSGGVWMTRDGGQSWAEFNTGLGNTGVHRLALGMTDAQNGVLFAATEAGIWQTPVVLRDTPQVTITPQQVDFGAVEVRHSSGIMTVTLTNTGTIPVTVAAVQVGGANAADFPVQEQCTARSPIAPGGSCTVFVQFVPRGTAARTATLTFTDDASSMGQPRVHVQGTQIVALAGTGVPGRMLLPLIQQ